LYEDEKIISFLDIFPASPGHSLVLPKEHFGDLREVPGEVLASLMEAAKKVAGGVLRGMEAEGFNLFLNNGRAAGQEVEHVHLHILPRSSGDGLRLHLPQQPYPEGEIEKVCQRIRMALEAESNG